MSSKLQRITTISVLRATLRNEWYRAGADDAHGSPAGERVTLASLFRGRMLVRRAWRGVDGEASAAYEYRASDQLMVAAKASGLLDLIQGSEVGRYAVDS